MDIRHLHHSHPSHGGMVTQFLRPAQGGFFNVICEYLSGCSVSFNNHVLEFLHKVRIAVRN